MELSEYIRRLENNNYKVEREYEEIHISSSYEEHNGDLMSVPVWAESINECMFCTDGVRRDSLAFLLDLTAKYIHTSKANRGLPETGMYRIKLPNEKDDYSLGNKYLGYHGGFTVVDAKDAIILTKEDIEAIRKCIGTGFLIDWDDFEPVTEY